MQVIGNYYGDEKLREGSVTSVENVDDQTVNPAPDTLLDPTPEWPSLPGFETDL
jgi:hypothetical protein